MFALMKLVEPGFDEWVVHYAFEPLTISLGNLHPEIFAPTS